MRRAGQSLDLGGIGKGFAAERVVQAYRDRGVSSAFVNLGDLSTDDVSVQLLHGRVSPDDRITHAAKSVLALQEKYDGGRYRYEGTVQLDNTGPFGYSVRIIPAHVGLVSDAEMGLQVLPN